MGELAEKLGFDPSAPNPGVSTSENLGNEVAEVEVEVESNVGSEEGGRESTRTSFTKDTTVDQSISNYDNFSADDFSFEARRAGRRDANDAIGDYVARVAGVSLDVRVGQKRADEEAERLSRQATEDGMVAQSIERQRMSRANALEASRLDRTQFSDSSTYVDDWRAAQEVDSFSDISAQDIATQARTGQIGRDKWGAFREGQKSVLGAAAGNWDNPNLRPGDYTDSLGTTKALRQAQDAQDELGIITSGTTPVVNAQAIATVVEDATRDRLRAWEKEENLDLDFITDVSSTPRTQAQIDLDQLISEEIKQADKVVESANTTTEQKNAAISDKNRLMMNQRRNRARQEYNAVTDPTASVYSKDVHTRVGLEKLNDYIASVANRPLFNTGLTYTKHDPATTMKVQKAIDRYDDIYGSWLNDMGKRNSKAINAKGFDMSKGLSGFNMIQGLMNKFGFAYHATATEKQLRAIKAKWGLDEDEAEGGLPLDQQETRCNERSGYKWDEETNTCIPISNLNTDYQDYLP